MSSRSLSISDHRNAWQLAVEAHKGQKYGKHLYTKHLRDVYHVLIEFGVTDRSTLEAGILHDVFEDTSVTQHQLLQAGMSHATIEIIHTVTDPTGKTRKERKEKFYKRLHEKINKGTLNPWSIIVKLADRIANVRECRATKNDRLLKLYREEQGHLFIVAMRVENRIIGSMIAELESLLRE